MENTWKYINSYYDYLHLSDKTRNKLDDLDSIFLINLYKSPLINYISFCKPLNLISIKEVIVIAKLKYVELIFL